MIVSGIEAPLKRKKPAKEFYSSWIFEAFDRDPGFYQKRMFGCLAAYFRGRLVMALAEDPGEKSYRGKRYSRDLWDGVLLPTQKEFHGALKEQFPFLIEHPVLSKWLYLPARDENFESGAREIARLIAQGDPRLGVDPLLRKTRKRTS